MTLFLRALTRLPLPVLYGVGWVLQGVLFRALRWRRSVAEANLRAAFPGAGDDQIGGWLRQSYRNLGVVAAEAFYGVRASREEMRQRVLFENPEVVDDHVRCGESVILLTGHFCNWEWLLTGGSASLPFPLDAVYKPVHSQPVDAVLREARARFGGTPIPVKSFLREIVRRRGAPHVYALVADQTPMRSEDKRWVRFLGRETAFYTGADKIARMLQAPVFFVTMRRLSRGRYAARFEPLVEPPYDRVDPGLVVDRYVAALEREIRESPGDWLWVHRKWKYTRDDVDGAGRAVPPS